MVQQNEFRVPRSRVDRLHAALRDDLARALDPVLCGRLPDEGRRTRGALEERFGAAVGQSFAYGTHSGTVGLVLALRACGVGSGEEVITVANSDISTTAAISHCGATPVLCDVLETDFTIDPDLVEGLITERTKALLPVDLYGHPTNVRRLREIADRHGLRIVEDAALAVGAVDYGRPVGAFADATVFSFAPFKPLGCVGNGAMVTTDDAGIARRVRNFGGYGREDHPPTDALGFQRYVVEGYNVPLDPLQAAVLGVKLPFLSEWTEKRRALANTYAEGLAGLAVGLPSFRPESAPTFRSYVVRVRERDRIYQALLGAGVEVVVHYAPPMSRQPVYGGRLRGSDRLPFTDRLAGEILCLPVAVELAEEDVRYVVDALGAALVETGMENGAEPEPAAVAVGAADSRKDGSHV